MTDQSFRAIVVTESDDNTFTRQIMTRSVAELPDHEVLIKVNYSSLNYKDALSATGNKGVTKQYPHTPGIDAAGIVESCTTDDFQAGDAVIVTSYDLGMDTPGGFGGYIRVPAAWVVPLPDGLSLKESMIYGTAGFTAALSLMKLEQTGVTPNQGEILVTGATGGVGSTAVAILAQRGYHVVAATGKTDAAPFLTDIGAAEVISREDASDDSSRPMLKGRWAGVVDTVGGDILATALKSTQYGGAVTCCGLVASPKLSTTVFPFILRGVSLIGIESVSTDMATRRTLWQHLASDWKPAKLETLATMKTLEALDPEFDRILQGGQRGRIVVEL